MRSLALTALLALAGTLSQAPAVAQTADSLANPSRPLFIGIEGHRGSIAQTNDFLTGENATGKPMKEFSAASITVGWQTTGQEEWEHAHNFPAYGLGVSTAWICNKDEIGQPISLFGFFHGVFGRWGRHSLHYDVEGGIAFNWDCYDERHNPNNIAVGSKVTVHVALGIKYNLLIGDRLTLGLGYGLKHFSNGAVRKPNKGLNLMTPMLSLAYTLSEPVKLPARKQLVKQKGNEVDLAIGYGFKRFEVDTVQHPELHSIYNDGPHYNAVTLRGAFLHRYCHRGKYGAGLQMVYDDCSGSDIKVEGGKASVVRGPMSKRLYFGVFAAHEFCVSNVALVTQFGVYLHRPSGLPTEGAARHQRKDLMFQRMGIKYTFPANIYAGVNIYAHRFSVADFVEWSIGYSLPVAKRR